MSRRVKFIALLATLVGALALTTGSAAAGGYYRHGYFGDYDSYPRAFGFGLGVRYGTYYYAPPPVYYYDPEPGCGWEYARIWRYGRWRSTRIWRCW